MYRNDNLPSLSEVGIEFINQGPSFKRLRKVRNYVKSKLGEVSGSKIRKFYSEVNRMAVLIPMLPDENSNTSSNTRFEEIKRKLYRLHMILSYERGRKTTPEEVKRFLGDVQKTVDHIITKVEGNSSPKEIKKFLMNFKELLEALVAFHKEAESEQG